MRLADAGWTSDLLFTATLKMSVTRAKEVLHAQKQAKHVWNKTPRNVSCARAPNGRFNKVQQKFISASQRYCGRWQKSFVESWKKNKGQSKSCVGSRLRHDGFKRRSTVLKSSSLSGLVWSVTFWGGRRFKPSPAYIINDINRAKESMFGGRCFRPIVQVWHLSRPLTSDRFVERLLRSLIHSSRNLV